MEKRNRVLSGRGAEGLEKAKRQLVGAFAAAQNGVLKGRVDGESVEKAKKDILGAFAVAEHVMGAIDSILSPIGDGEGVLDEEPAPPEPVRRQRIEAQVVGKKPDGTLQIVLHDPRRR
jgi:hypothetical protein